MILDNLFKNLIYEPVSVLGLLVFYLEDPHLDEEHEKEDYQGRNQPHAIELKYGNGC